jgi:hypothetical protein
MPGSCHSKPQAPSTATMVYVPDDRLLRLASSVLVIEGLGQVTD